ILLRVADDCGLASRAAGCMYAHDLLARHGEHAERIVRAQVVLHRERKLCQILERAQILGMDAGGAEAFSIVSDVVVCVPYGPLQALQLQSTQLVDAGLLDRLEVHGVAVMLPPIWCERPRKSATHSP